MSISEQVKELRDKANIFEKSGWAVDGIIRAFRESADTIELLSEKLQAEKIKGNGICEVILQNIEKEMEEMKSIWSGLEKPPYSEFEQELYLSGLKKAMEIILQSENTEHLSENCGKSVLEIETPKYCIDCPCHFAGESGMVMCGVEKRELLSEDIETYKPDWCPLREMSRDYDGWTYCGNGDNLPKESEYYDVTIESEINGEVVRTTECRCFHKDIEVWEELIEPEFAIDEIVIAWRHRPEPYHEH